MTDTFDIIINRRAGAVLNDGEGPMREALLKAFGDNAGSILFADGADVAGAVRGWVDAHAGSGRGLIIGGGDGTVLTAAGEMMSRDDVTLGILPMGTQNLFARRLGFTADYKQAAAQYQNSETCHVDVGVVNGLYFLVGIMLDENSVAFFEAREHLRDRNKWKALAASLSLPFASSETFVIQYDGGPAMEMSGKVVTITSNPLQPRANKGRMLTLNAEKLKEIGGNMFALGREAQGVLCLYILDAGILDGLSLIRSARDGTWSAHDAVTVQRAKTFVITPDDDLGDERKIILDGEIKTTRSTMNISLIEKGLKVYRPKLV